MKTENKGLHVLIGLGIVLLQLVMTQVVTFLASLLFPGMETMGNAVPTLFVAILGITFSTGVFVTGWLALKWQWLKVKPKYSARLVATLFGAYIPLIAGLILYRTLEPGNPFFVISTLACILGFYIPGWIERK